MENQSFFIIVHQPFIKEIQDVYSKLDSCISDWQNKDLCIRDSDNITNETDYAVGRKHNGTIKIIIFHYHIMKLLDVN